VTQEEVTELAKKMISEGEKPTIGRIRELLGNRGSPNTISRFLKYWREGEIHQIQEASDLFSADRSEEPQKQAPLEVQLEPKSTPAPVKPSVHQIEKPIVMEASSTQGKLVSESPLSSPSQASSPASASHSQPPRRDKPNHGHKNQNNGHSHQKNHHGQGGGKPSSPHHGGNGHPNNHHGHGNNHSNSQKREHRPPVSRPVMSFEDTVPNVYVSENLDTLTTTQLTAKVRRLESILNKEISRRERADSMARDAKEYAEAVKLQIGARINDIRQSMEMVIDSLQSQLKSLRENAEKDLRFYRDALQKANEHLANQHTKGVRNPL
jgi:hypothetical protein